MTARKGEKIRKCRKKHKRTLKILSIYQRYNYDPREAFVNGAETLFVLKLIKYISQHL